MIIGKISLMVIKYIRNQNRKGTRTGNWLFPKDSLSFSRTSGSRLLRKFVSSSHFEPGANWNPPDCWRESPPLQLLFITCSEMVCLWGILQWGWSCAICSDQCLGSYNIWLGCYLPGRSALECRTTCWGSYADDCTRAAAYTEMKGTSLLRETSMFTEDDKQTLSKAFKLNVVSEATVMHLLD